MDCIYCGEKTYVPSRWYTKARLVRRLRVCRVCKRTFNTTEVADDEGNARNN